MFSPEIREMKADCWQSPFRCVARDDDGRPTHYVALTDKEMLRAAMTGSVSIPDEQLPQAAIDYRERQRELADA